MRVIVLGRTIPEKETGLKGLFEFNQAKSLKKRKVDVVYTFIDNRSLIELRKVSNYIGIIEEVPVYGIFTPIRGLPYKIFDWIKYKQFKYIINKIIKNHGNFDIIHVHFPLYTLNDYIIKYLNSLNIKLVVTEHWSKTLTMNLSKREERMLNSLLNLSDEFIAVSSKLKKSILNYKNMFNTSRDINLKVIPNIIQSEYSYVKRDDDSYFTFVSIGRLTKSKNNDLLIKAFKLLSKDIDSIKLVIIGDGLEMRRLKKLVTKFKLNKQVKITGYLDYDKIMDFFKKVDVYITASKVETFGVPVVESWMMGRPVIIGNNHPLENLVDKNYGLVYDYSDNNDILIKNLAENMRNIIDISFQNEKLSKEANDKFSEENISNKIINNVYKTDNTIKD